MWAYHDCNGFIKSHQKVTSRKTEWKSPCYTDTGHHFSINSQVLRHSWNQIQVYACGQTFTVSQ